MTSELPERIAFLGFGLIGGSIARALRSAGAPSRLVAWTPEGRGPSEGLREGLLDEVSESPGGAIRDAELVILAGPPQAVAALVTDMAGTLRESLSDTATITDVASSKALIVERAGAAGLPFVGGHPMAGREDSGVAASTADLFAGRPWVIVPASSSHQRDVERVEALVAAVGARPIRMSSDEHDAAVAAISHLPLIAAAALVEAVAGSDAATRPGWPSARDLAASGWADMTRLAKGDPAMGAGILSTNAGPIAARLRAYRDALDTWIGDLERAGGPDVDGLHDRLRGARDRLEAPPE